MNLNGNNGNSSHDVLRLLFEQGQLEQVEAAGMLGVTRAACNLHFQRLAMEHLIEPADAPESRRGRPARPWRVSPANGFLGFVLQRSGIFVELLDFNGRTLRREAVAFASEPSPAEVQCELSRMVNTMKSHLAPNGKLLQIFVGVPGAIAADGTILNSPNFPALNGWNPDCFFREAGYASYTDTIGFAVIQGETSDAPRDAVTLILDWSEGFGLSFAVNGEPMLFPAFHSRRYHGLWDFGHMRIELDGLPCHCGKRGCLEAYIGGLPLIERHPELGCAGVVEFASRLAGGDENCRRVFSPAVKRLTQALYPHLELFGVERIILAGAMREAFKVFAGQFRNELAKFYHPGEIDALGICAGGDAFPTYSHGAALTARKYFLYPEHTGRYRGIGQNIHEN